MFFREMKFDFLCGQDEIIRENGSTIYDLIRMFDIFFIIVYITVMDLLVQTEK